MKNTLKLLALMAGMLMAMTACTPKKSDASQEAQQPQNAAGVTTTENSIVDENNPKALAKQAYDCIMQLEGRDNHDPAVVAKMSAIQEIVEKLPEADQITYYAEVERLYLGETDSEEDRDILFELKSPRMNSQDILNFQNRLLSLGFSGIGSADGYYGPLSEGVIKIIQTFSGYKSDGKVDRKLSDFLFNNSNTEFLKNMSTVFAYDPKNLAKSRDLYGDEPGDERAHVYYSPIDKKARIVEHIIGTGFTENYLTYYFVNDAYYFVKSVNIRWDVDSNTRVIDVQEMYLRTWEGIYNIKNGIFEPSDNQGIIGLQSTIIDKFFDEHR